MIQLYMAVSDDDNEICNVISAYAERLAKEKGFSVKVDVFSSGDALLQSGAAKYHMVFLDIETEGSNGLETARRLRADKYQREIVFISGISDYCAKGYRYKAYSFLVKPIYYEYFCFELNELFSFLKRREELIRGFLGKDKKEIPGCQSIFYIEVMNHTIFYHSEEKTVEKIGNMREVERDYAPLGFSRIHQSYLVNMEKIMEIYPGKIVLENKVLLPVSRSREEQFMERYASFCMERM